MALPMAALSIPSIFIGYLSRDSFVGLGTPFWGNSFGASISSSDYAIYLNAEFLPFYIKIVPVICSTLGTVVAIVYYSFFVKGYNIAAYARLIPLYTFLSKKWYFDKMYNEFIVQYFLSLGYGVTYKSVDRGFLEVFGPTGVAKSLDSVTQQITFWQNGLPYNYIRQFVFGTFLILFILSGTLKAFPLELFILLCLILS